MAGKKNILIYIISLFVCTVLFVSCPSNEQYGYDADYFIGLQKLSEGNIKEAKLKFNNCIKKGTYYCAKESAIQLTKLGNLQENNAAAEFLFENFPDPDSLLILAQQYNTSSEFRKLLEITNTIDFATAEDALIKLRLNTLLKLNMQEKFEEEAYLWFTSRAISQEQYQYFRDIYSPLCIPEETEDSQPENLTPKAEAVIFRITLYKRNYLLGYENASRIFSYFENGELKPVSMLASDIGKSYLYGTEQIKKDLFQLDNLASRVVVLEIEDVLNVGSAEGVYTLGIVAYHADVLVGGGQFFDNQVLGKVGVLVLVHQNIAETLLVFVQYLRIVA